MKRFRIEIKWAIVFVIVSLIWMEGEKLLGLHSSHIDKYLYFKNLFAIPAILIYFLALRDKNLHYYSGKMRYMQGLWSGLFLSLIVTVLIPLSQFITFTVISPDYFSNFIQYAVENGQMEQSEAESYFSLGNFIFIGMFSAPILGIVTSAFVSIFVRTKTQASNQ